MSVIWETAATSLPVLPQRSPCCPLAEHPACSTVLTTLWPKGKLSIVSTTVLAVSWVLLSTAYLVGLLLTTSIPWPFYIFIIILFSCSSCSQNDRKSFCLAVSWKCVKSDHNVTSPLEHCLALIISLWKS